MIIYILFCMSSINSVPVVLAVQCYAVLVCRRLQQTLQQIVVGFFIELQVSGVGDETGELGRKVLTQLVEGRCYFLVFYQLVLGLRSCGLHVLPGKYAS